METDDPSILHGLFRVLLVVEDHGGEVSASELELGPREEDLIASAVGRNLLTDCSESTVLTSSPGSRHQARVRIRFPRVLKITVAGKAFLAEYRLKEGPYEEPRAAGQAGEGSRTPTGGEPEACSTMPTPTSPRPERELQPWCTAADGAVPLRGWEDICTALQVQNDQNTRRRIKRLNKSTDGPIVYVRNKPEVNRGQLLAWMQDSIGRAEATERVRESRTAAVQDLEKGGATRQRDFGLHPETRPNAKGKARPAPEEP